MHACRCFECAYAQTYHGIYSTYLARSTYPYCNVSRVAIESPINSIDEDETAFIMYADASTCPSFIRSLDVRCHACRPRLCLGADLVTEVLSSP
jgi:hypothetical protein